MGESKVSSKVQAWVIAAALSPLFLLISPICYIINNVLLCKIFTSISIFMYMFVPLGVIFYARGLIYFIDNRKEEAYTNKIEIFKVMFITGALCIIYNVYWIFWIIPSGYISSIY